jgi:NAD+ kinase
MRKIGLITNLDKDISAEYTKITACNIVENGGEVVIPEKLPGFALNNCYTVTPGEAYENVDAIICIGGDGTFLKVARNAYKKGIPILGVNLGHLGFLTEIDKDEIASSVKMLLEGNYHIEERMMLDAVVVNKDGVHITDVALNDVVVSRIAISRILHLDSFINNVFADSFPGDGIIVASPTGSTAYSLSAGGPIIEPDTELMVMTPICPHILYSRSIITKGSSIIKIQLNPKYNHEAMVTIDGQICHNMVSGDFVEVKKSDKYVKIIRLQKKGFFSILRSKIYDRNINNVQS